MRTSRRERDSRTRQNKNNTLKKEIFKRKLLREFAGRHRDGRRRRHRQRGGGPLLERRSLGRHSGPQHGRGQQAAKQRIQRVSLKKYRNDLLIKSSARDLPSKKRKIGEYIWIFQK